MEPDEIARSFQHFGLRIEADGALTLMHACGAEFAFQQPKLDAVVLLAAAHVVGCETEAARA